MIQGQIPPWRDAGGESAAGTAREAYVGPLLPRSVGKIADFFDYLTLKGPSRAGGRAFFNLSVANGIETGNNDYLAANINI